MAPRPSFQPSDIEAHLASSPMGVVAFDPDFRVTRWEGASERIFGWTAEEVLGKRIEELPWVYEEDVPLVRRVSDDMAAGRRRSFVSTNRNRRKDGAVIHCEWYNSALYDASGRLRSVLARVLDVTARVRAEAALRESEGRLRAVVENTLDTIVIQDRDLRFEYAVNPAFGFPPAQMLGRTDADLFPPDLAARIGALKLQAMNTGRPVHVETSVTTLAGQPKVLEGDFVPRTNEHGEVDGVIGYFHDVTVRKRAELETAALQMRLAEAERVEAVGRLAGGMAHELNNMLQAMMTDLEVLAMDAPDEEARQVAAEARAEGARASDLIAELLSLAGKQRVTTRDVVLEEVVAGLLPELRDLAGADIEVTWSPGAPSRLRADPERLREVLRHLVANARDAILQNGRVELATTPVTLDEAFCASHPGHEAGPAVRLDVKDNGRGMTPGVRTHLFEPFFTTAPFGQRRGLGLPVVMGIVRQHHGAVQVDSELGRGTTVSIWLPRIA